MLLLCPRLCLSIDRRLDLSREYRDICSLCLLHRFFHFGVSFFFLSIEAITINRLQEILGSFELLSQRKDLFTLVRFFDRLSVSSFNHLPDCLCANNTGLLLYLSLGQLFFLGG